MILIADSGSTKTQWCLCAANGQHSEFFTSGINPFYQSEEEIRNSISEQLLPQLSQYMWVGPVNKIFFYGAGCSFPEKKDMVASALRFCFVKADIEIESDLLGAARALFQREKGVACIMGTGSNSCFYNGVEIEKNVSPLGFILGDEGSGAVLGKRLVADLLKNQLGEELKEKFLSEYQLSPADILDAVYKKPFPNRFLAKFSRFLSENIKNPAIYNIVYDSFDTFVVRNLQQYDLVNNKVGFIGSIAYYYADILREVLKNRGACLVEIEQSPMPGMIAYHKN